MMEWKNVLLSIFRPESLSQTTLSFSLLYMWNAKHFFHPALNAYRMDGFDLSLLIISPRFCLVQQKKNPCAFINVAVSFSFSLIAIWCWCFCRILFTLHLCVPMHCFYITKDTLFSRFLTADCLFVCTFSIYFDWTRIEWKRKLEKGNQYTHEMCIEKFKKNHEKILRN